MFNNIKTILHLLIKSNLICIMAEIIKTLIIWCIRNLSGFNRSIINLSRHIKLIIEIAFFESLQLFLRKLKNIIKQLLNKNRLRYEFELFFDTAYKIRVTVAILGLFRLILNNLSLDFTWMQWCKNSWLENSDNLYLQNI